MNKKHVFHLIDDYIDGTLAAEDRKKVELHLKECPQCRKKVSEIESVVHDLHRLPKSIELPEKLQKAIDNKLLEYGTNHHTPQRKRTQVWNLFEPKSIIRLAAGFAVLIGAGIIIWLYLRDNTHIERTTVQQIEALPSTDSIRQEYLPEQKINADANKKTLKKEPKPLLAEKVKIDSSSRINIEVEKIPVKVSIKKQNTEQGEIYGVVTDSLDGEPLIGVNIILEGTSIRTFTGINGEFQFKNVPEGLYKIKVSYIGYRSQTIGNVSIKPDISHRMDFKLYPQSFAAGEVVVTAQMRALKYTINSQLSSNTISSMRGVESNYKAARLYGDNLSDRLDPSFNTEAYSKINENEFKDALTNPLSTFSIDVDAASYSNIRRFINSGSLPPIDVVRIEEMINYFKYDYPQPANQHPFSVNTEVSVCPWNADNSLLLIGLQGKNINTENIPPCNLVFLLDVSGSMDEPEKLPLVKSAFRLLVNQLRSVDRVAIVVYAGNAGLVLPSTSGDEKERILKAIDNLEAGGSTAGGQGIILAYKTAKENFLKDGNNRVILATDGDFNVGVSSDSEMERLIEEKRNDGIYLSVLGFGTGNYKDSKMEKLADKGNGNYAYVDNIQEARKVFGEQLAGTLYTIAKDVKIQIEFNPAIIKSYRLIGYENRLLNKEDFKDDKKDAGELGSGHTVTALYELVLNDQETNIQNIDSLKYQTIVVKPESFNADEMLTVKLRYKLPEESTSNLITKPVRKSIKRFDDASRNLRFASSVAMFGMMLRDSKEKGDSSYDLILENVKRSLGADKEGYNSEFVRLVEICRQLDD
ncbi:MAG: von Willebrand factor type A domain-containing protein [Bacteroidetes bacterium]|nr:von Willebrand factor type A domain-containing protein [Bacteroidota bacterium]